MQQTTIYQVIDIASKVFNVPASSLSPDSSAHTVENWDSLGHASFIAEIENSLDVKFTLIELVTLSTIQEIANNIDSKQNAG